MTDEPQQSIKVVDRRGSAKTNQKEDSASATEGAKKADTAGETSATVDSHQGASPTAADDGSTAEVRDEQAQNQSGGQGQQVDFPSFVLSFYTQALVMMGEVPNPETGLVTANLEAARQTIDILEMVQEKTKGNLSPDESRLISEVVANLQMAYVNKIK